MRIRHVLVPAALLAATLLTGCTSGTGSDSSAGSVGTAETAAAGECGYIESPGGVRDVDLPLDPPIVSGTVNATMATNVGDIHLTLNADRTPCTVGSFVSLAQQKFFDDTTCHRLTLAESSIFVLQCGDPSASGQGGPGYRFDDELDASEVYPAGTVAMANSGPNTNGSQFFLVYEDTPLSADYTVFGTMDEASIEIVRGVAAKGVSGGAPDQGAPAQAVDIATMTIED